VILAYNNTKKDHRGHLRAVLEALAQQMIDKEVLGQSEV